MSMNTSQNKNIDLNHWKRLFGYAMQTPRIVFGVLAAMSIVSVVDVVYPLLTRTAIDKYVIPRTSEGLTSFIVLYVGLVLLQGFCTFCFIERAGKLEMEVASRIRRDAFQKLQILSFSFFDTTAVGYLMSRMVSDVSRLSEMLAWSLVDLLWASVYAISCIAVMFVLNVKLALIVISVIPPLAVISFFLQRKILELQRDARKQNSKITAALNEGISGAVTTKTLVLEQENAKAFSSLTKEMRRVSIRSGKASALFLPLVVSLGAVGTCLALTLGGNSILNASHHFVGVLSIGTLVSFISYSTQLFDPIQQLAGIIAELQSAQASAERVLDLIDTQPDIADSADIEKTYGDFFQPNPDNWEDIKGEIRFDHVTFRYKNGEKVLDNFNLTISPGESIALVGKTGAGKSTIVNLLCRFYEPTSGDILIDGKSIRARSQLWLQSKLGYVLQSPHLFSGTIRENIAFAKPWASDEEIRSAARAVNADSFIEKLQDGYNTFIGEDGALLSVGEKQLISFARALLADPKIFVLDEATSSVDTETELLIRRAIKNTLKGRTSFIIAHRLSTIRDADRIIVIDDGQILESGSHSELLAAKGAYYELYTRQFAEEKTVEALR